MYLLRPTWNNVIIVYNVIDIVIHFCFCSIFQCMNLVIIQEFQDSEISFKFWYYSYSIFAWKHNDYMLYFKVVSFVLFSYSIYIITRNERLTLTTPLIIRIFFRSVVSIDVYVRIYHDFFFPILSRLTTKWKRRYNAYYVLRPITKHNQQTYDTIPFLCEHCSVSSIFRSSIK